MFQFCEDTDRKMFYRILGTSSTSSPSAAGKSRVFRPSAATAAAAQSSSQHRTTAASAKEEVGEILPPPTHHRGGGGGDGDDTLGEGGGEEEEEQEEGIGSEALSGEGESGGEGGLQRMAPTLGEEASTEDSMEDDMDTV